MALLYFVPLLRIVLGGLFLFASSMKIRDLKGFARIIRSYGLLPKNLERPLSYAQPFFELFVGAWILSGQLLFWSAIAGLSLMIVANVFVGYALLKRKRLGNCGCYGVAISVPLSWKKFFENCIWTVLFILLIIASAQ
ncbi:DoxX family membrane protein [Candidatus Woesearchaeota archaeon]|nr:MAG: DoxX family membrane protein [Candidatus Woesearchaeota archaeon]